MHTIASKVRERGVNTHLVLRGVRKVDAHHIHASTDAALERLSLFGSGSNGCDNLDMPRGGDDLVVVDLAGRRAQGTAVQTLAKGGGTRNQRATREQCSAPTEV